jgi:protein phosphatase methylesterase 1
MSELQRTWAKAKLNSLDTFPEVMGGEEDQDEEMDGVSELPEGLDDDSSSASSASSASSTGTVIPSPSQRLFARPQG